MIELTKDRPTVPGTYEWRDGKTSGVRQLSVYQWQPDEGMEPGCFVKENGVQVDWPEGGWWNKI
jgi:hypothetical protein